MTLAPQRPRLALLLMLAAQVAFVLMQVIVKRAREQGLDTSEVMFFRTAPALPLLWWILHRQGFGLRSKQPTNVVTRSLLGSFAMATNFTAMLWLSLAQFSTLGLSQPVFVAVFAPLLLGERVSPRTWVAIALACAGAFVIVAPGLEDRSLPTVAALLAIASALSSAFAHIWVRKATAHDPPERVVFHFAAWVALLALIFGLPRGFFVQLPVGMTVEGFLLLALGMSVFGTIGQILMTRAHVYGEASSVAMVGYTSVAFGSLADLFFWERAPELSAATGAALMLAAGVVITRKGKVVAKATIAHARLSPEKPRP